MWFGVLGFGWGVVREWIFVCCGGGNEMFELRGCWVIMVCIEIMRSVLELGLGIGKCVGDRVVRGEERLW